MEQSKQSLLTTTIQLKGIEMLGGALNIPTDPQEPMTFFNFNVNIASQVNVEEKLVFVVVTIDTTNADKTEVYGSLTASCIFHVPNFDEIMTFNPDGTCIIPTQLTDILHAISISTMRGIMFSTFKGTFLHNAILPIMNVQQFQPIETK